MASDDPVLNGAGAFARPSRSGRMTSIRRWWAVLAAFFAVFSIIASAPAHALEGVKSAPIAAQSVSQLTTVKIEGSVSPGKINIHALPGHSCATHCAGHTLAHPDNLAWASPDARASVRWTLTSASPANSNHGLGLKRPPRA